ncbi:hypothetical protein EIN_321630 [Entamoeba invadens IP1]|uniref:Leucine rich repeat containing protein BspA family protein n=1 Tax=Entamoeba invadens IP1 TaxID=370355 RepID=A0A0A1UGW6_ENTIV|nr:hypothetical protein EIN_321630 [Entamoeba invadens IP1]ELP93740.1 hypothetical protein EIN_321630 [Entamoeba invadens IP1]|eukprot:XP_004260511.1 hypothetical protein EIN_321630 [Entamoeba invadens IP1]
MFANDYIKNLNLGNIKEIDEYCFGSALEEVTIPTTLTKIGHKLFTKCNNLRKVDLCGKGSFSGEVTFEEKKKLEKCGVHCDKVVFTYKDYSQMKFVTTCDVLSLSEGNNLIQSLPSIVIPDTIQVIFNNCFANCMYLEEIVLPSKLTEICNFAFFKCYSLNKIVLPTHLQIIGKSAFMFCASLKDIDIPSSVTFIGKSAFEGCVKLQKVVSPTIVFNSPKVFKRCCSLTKIDVLHSREMNITMKKTFKYSYQLSSIDIPKSVIKIGDYTFKNMYWLDEISVPQNVVLIGNKAFLHCNLLTQIVFGHSLQEIGAFCFKNCSKLEQLYFPKSLTFIKKNAFIHCDKLSCLHFEGKFPKCQIETFNSCNNLKNITIEGNKINEIEQPVTFTIADNFEKHQIHCKNVIFTKVIFKRI